MTTEALTVAHLIATSTDSNDPTFDGVIAAKLAAKALQTIAQKLDVLAAKLNADAGVTDTNYAIDFESTLLAVTP